jgi:hypothetical protein
VNQLLADAKQVREVVEKRHKCARPGIEDGRGYSDTPRTMTVPKVLLRALLTLVAIAVIAMPASGVHLHLCFDGAEAPATVHFGEDGKGHTEPATQGTHSDTDVELGAPAVAKKADRTFDLPSLMVVAHVLLRVPVPAQAVLPETDDATVIVSSSYRILPPLRAPPV